MIIPRIKPSNWELFLIYHKTVIFSQKLLKRESFLSSSLTCLLLLAIQKLPLSFLIHSHYFCIYIYICKFLYRLPFTECNTYLWNSWQIPWGCCSDSCAISWVNQIIKETKKMQKLLKTDSPTYRIVLYLQKHSKYRME